MFASTLTVPIYDSNHNNSLVLTKHPPATLIPMKTFMTLSIGYISRIWLTNSDMYIPINQSYGIRLGSFGIMYEAKLPTRPTDIAHAITSIIVIEAQTPRQLLAIDWDVEKFALRENKTKAIVAGIAFHRFAQDALTITEGIETLDARAYGVKIKLDMIPSLSISSTTVVQVFLLALHGLIWPHESTATPGSSLELRKGRTWQSRNVNGATIRIKIIQTQVCKNVVTYTMMEEGLRMIWSNMPDGAFGGGFSATIGFQSKRGPVRPIVDVQVGLDLRVADDVSSENGGLWAGSDRGNETVQVYRRDDDCES